MRPSSQVPRHLLSVTAVAVMLTLAFGSDSDDDSAPEPTPTVDAAPDEASAAPVSAPPAPNTGLGGWLAFPANTDGDNPKYPGADIAIFIPQEGDNGGWKGQAAGTKFRLVGSSSASITTLNGTADQPYGCNDIPTPMVGLRAPALDGDLAYWVGEGEPLGKIVAKDVSATRRTWTVGSITLTLERTANMEAMLHLDDAGSRILTSKHEKYLMEGAEPGPIDLSSEWPDVGMPMPQGAWKLPGNKRVIALKSQGYEGWGISMLVIEDGMARPVDGPSVYRCAF